MADLSLKSHPEGVACNSFPQRVIFSPSPNQHSRGPVSAGLFFAQTVPFSPSRPCLPLHPVILPCLEMSFPTSSLPPPCISSLPCPPHSCNNCNCHVFRSLPAPIRFALLAYLRRCPFSPQCLLSLFVNLPPSSSSHLLFSPPPR